MKKAHLEFFDHDSQVKICFSDGKKSEFLETKLNTLAHIIYYFGAGKFSWEEVCEMIVELQNSILPFQIVDPSNEITFQIDFSEVANTIFYSFGYVADLQAKSDIPDDLRQEIDDHLEDKTSLN